MSDCFNGRISAVTKERKKQVVMEGKKGDRAEGLSSSTVVERCGGGGKGAGGKIYMPLYNKSSLQLKLVVACARQILYIDQYVKGGDWMPVPPIAMSCLGWNCRGLGNPRAVRRLRDFLRRENPDIVFLSETRKRYREMESLKWRLGYANGVWVSCVERRGVDLGGPQWRIIGFYGNPVDSERHVSWQLLKSLKQASRLPWLCFGDFNEITRTSEKLGGARKPERLMAAFRDVIHYCNFEDLGFIGYPLTWDNGREGSHNIQLRLDRALATSDWVSLFPSNQVYHIFPRMSDHCPIKVCLQQEQRQMRNRRTQTCSFRFENHWLRDEECMRIVEDVWCSGGASLSFGGLATKMKMTGEQLFLWNRRKFGSLPWEIARLRAEVAALQTGASSRHTSRSRKEAEDLLDSLLHREEEIWRQ
ncbi:hypothetical protein Tsubulata_037290 [Turnera subulata]|uniref:Endonuclease/exonuclease/phosphatase domain-containing protein n=1 Tax=Turnera subulata TaxID=218843 RepID=A0A9Q0FBR6_9ROSI|nr:hypothetical protein Tsubulata_037290 [Turnera subulata]